MIFRRISFGTEEYAQECKLRHEVLRKPLGLNLYDENLDVEREQMHFGLFDEAGTLHACVIAVGISNTDAKIRQMVVRPERQRLGYGKKILQELQAYLALNGYTKLSLHARVSATNFYEQQGFKLTLEEFIEVGIPHVAMQKSTPPESR